jgi:hypothetical protein
MKRRFVLAVGLVVTGSLAGMGCGSEEGPPYARLADCPAGWLPLAPFHTESISGPDSMVWADGLLYQARRRISETIGSGIVVVPADDDATATVLVRDDGVEFLWVEGENLL